MNIPPPGVFQSFFFTFFLQVPLVGNLKKYLRSFPFFDAIRFPHAKTALKYIFIILILNISDQFLLPLVLLPALSQGFVQPVSACHAFIKCVLVWESQCGSGSARPCLGRYKYATDIFCSL